jgi:hypothetical protein
VISMHAWCGEEESNCSPGYPNSYAGYNNPLHTATQYTSQMRWYGEQAGQPTVPNPALPGVYLVQTYDIGDPQFCYATSPYGNCSSVGLAEGDPKCFCPQPPPLMGDIHPRNKLEVGRRAAMSLLALTADDSRTGSVGAFFHSCEVLSTGEISVTLAVTGGGNRADRGTGAAADTLQAPHHSEGFEVQLPNGTWIDAPIVGGGNETNTVRLQPSLPQHTASPLLGLRYAWRDHPCCPRFYSADPVWSNWALTDMQHPPVMNGACPPKNCSLYTTGSDLPATPFTVAMGPRLPPPRSDEVTDAVAAGSSGSTSSAGVVQQRCVEFVSTATLSR